MNFNFFSVSTFDFISNSFIIADSITLKKYVVSDNNSVILAKCYCKLSFTKILATGNNINAGFLR